MKKLFNYIYLIPVIIIGLTLPYKFTGNGIEYLVTFFDEIFKGRGNAVMAAIGIPELAAIVMLLVPKWRHMGALKSLGIMLGAITTHIYLGIFDALFAQAIITFITSGIVAIQKRDEILDMIVKPFGYTHVKGYYRKTNQP